MLVSAPQQQLLAPHSYGKSIVHATFFLRFPPYIIYICPKMCYSKGKFVHNEMSFVYAVLNTKVCTTCKISQTLNCPVKKFSA